MVTSLVSLPPEILLIILDSLSVGDIVRVAQTSSALRRFVLSNRIPLSKSFNHSYTLHLPLTCTTKNLSPQLLYTHAVKSMAISARLAQSLNGSPIQPRQSVVYSLEALETKWDPTKPPVGYFVRDRILAFLNQQGIFVLLLGEAGDIEKHARLELQAEFETEIAYQMSQDENSLLVATVSLRDNGDLMHVREVCIAKDGFGSISNHLEIGLPLDTTSCVAIRDPYCVAVNTEEAYLVNWREKTGQWLKFHPHNMAGDKPGRDWTLFDILTIIIHPKEPVLVIFDCSDDHPTSGMYLADIPKAMQSIEETVRHIHSLKTRSAPVWTSPFTPETGSDPESYEGKMFSMGFRRLSDSFWILDVLISGDIAETSDPDAPPDRSALARVSYDLSENWTAQIE
ncbi:hypothetical protein SISNIDRAFT_456985, partial [Sistotremastrum niveocremeum HHB9708]